MPEGSSIRESLGEILIVLGGSVIGDLKACYMKDPLPTITIEDPNDTVAVKRAENTLLARKSREKYQEQTEALLSPVNISEEEAEK